MQAEKGGHAAMPNKMQQCYVSIIGNPHWRDPRPLFKTKLTEIDQVAQQVLDACSFAGVTGIDRFAVFLEIAFFNPPAAAKIETRVRTVKKEKLAVVNWQIYPRTLPDEEPEWVSVYVALLIDSIERVLDKFKIEPTSELGRLRSMSPRQINLIDHFANELYSPWQSDSASTEATDETSPAIECPELIAINHDDCHAQYVGHTSDGRQFFLTTPFIPALNGAGNEFLALYLFDKAGNLLDAKIDEFGATPKMDIGARRELRDKRLKDLGSVVFGRIEVKPFCIEKFCTSFGLIPTLNDDVTGDRYVELQPGNYMAFHEPWDSGEYDT
jgi:hypothetical protein